MGKNLSQDKNLTGWILGLYSQESTNKKSSGYKYEESYHYPNLSQNTNLQLNICSNIQLDLIL